MTPDEIEHLVRETVRETLRLLGIDIDSQESVNRMRADLIAAREIREWRDTARRRFWFAVISVAVLAAISALWEGIKVKLGL